MISPAAAAASLQKLWSPRVLAEVDDAYVKVARIQGTLAWHSHEQEDEPGRPRGGRLRLSPE